VSIEREASQRTTAVAAVETAASTSPDRTGTVASPLPDAPASPDRTGTVAEVSAATASPNRTGAVAEVSATSTSPNRTGTVASPLPSASTSPNRTGAVASPLPSASASLLPVASGRAARPVVAPGGVTGHVPHHRSENQEAQNQSRHRQAPSLQRSHPTE